MKERLYPINRSITGDGVRESLKILQETADFDIKEIPTGHKIFDWTVPKEWNIKGAKLEGKDGVIADFAETNLRVVGYSNPIDRDMKYGELEPHLHSHPNAIPYRTSYYKPDWGFCLTDREKKNLDTKGTYHAEIDSEVKEGSMTYGEATVHGKSGREFLITTYSCHPSMYNDNVSGMIVWARVLREMQRMNPNNTYHFFIGPETIGVLSLLQRKRNFEGALVINCVGKNEDFVLKQSMYKDSEVDRVAEQTLKEMGVNYTTKPFDVNGSDERQLQSPAFRIPTINLTRGDYYGSGWYHSSKDNMNDLKGRPMDRTLEGILDTSVEVYLNLLMNLDRDHKIYSTNRYGEPQLGKRGLYPTTGGRNETNNLSTLAKWIMHNDGGYLVDIAERTGNTMKEIEDVYKKLKEGGLLK